MAAVVLKNEPLDQARSVEVNVFDPGTSLGAEPGTDLADYAFVSQSTYKYVPATGTLANKRHTLVIADDVIEAVDTGTDSVTVTAHGYRTGDGPFDCDEILGDIGVGDDVYIIVDDENTIAFAATLADAYADNREALTGTETGATISDNADTERGIRGKWQYTFTQTETDVDACELSFAILGHATLEGGASINLERGGSSLLDETLEDDVTVGYGLRAVVRGELAPYEIDGNEHVVMSLDGTKESHRGTVTESGRSGMVLTDLSP
jgi:hypothetical protein